MGAVRSQRLAQSGLSRSASITGVVAIPRNAVCVDACRRRSCASSDSSSANLRAPAPLSSPYSATPPCRAAVRYGSARCSNSSSISISITGWCAPRALWQRLPLDQNRVAYLRDLRRERKQSPRTEADVDFRGLLDLIEVRLMCVGGGPTLDYADATAFLAGFGTVIEKVRKRRRQ